ncbi:protein of unknown function [Rhodovastum atsumiense]|nr:protein of unknown function [Rhodovastum atsumiense]
MSARRFHDPVVSPKGRVCGYERGADAEALSARRAGLPGPRGFMERIRLAHSYAIWRWYSGKNFQECSTPTWSDLDGDPLVSPDQPVTAFPNGGDAVAGHVWERRAVCTGLSGRPGHWKNWSE